MGKSSPGTSSMLVALLACFELTHSSSTRSLCTGDAGFAQCGVAKKLPSSHPSSCLVRPPCCGQYGPRQWSSGTARPPPNFISLRACIGKVPGNGEGPVVVPVPRFGISSIRVRPPGGASDPRGAEIGGDLDIRLASTIGWGDGHHPTTYLSLEFLAECIQEGMQVLDYGTGSAVLAMAARKLGSERVVGIDIDDEALDAALENLELNNISQEEVCLRHTREVVQSSDGIVLRDDARGRTLRFDVVVANILIGPLMKLAPILAMAVKEDTGTLCLCGLRQENIPDIKEAYARFGVEFSSQKMMEHTKWRPGAEGEGVWVRMVGTRRRLSPDERQASIAWWNEQAVS